MNEKKILIDYIIEILNLDFENIGDFNGSLLSKIDNNEYLKNNLQIQIKIEKFYEKEKEILFEGDFNDLSIKEKEDYIYYKNNTTIKNIIIENDKIESCFYLVLFYLSKIIYFDDYDGKYKSNINEFHYSKESESFICLYSIENYNIKEYFNSCKVIVQYEKINDGRTHLKLIEYLSSKINNQMKFIDKNDGVLIIYSQSNNYKDLLNICYCLRDSGFLNLDDKIYSNELEKTMDNRLYIKTDLMTYLDDETDIEIISKLKQTFNGKSIYSFKLSEPYKNTINYKYHDNYVKKIKSIYSFISNDKAKQIIEYYDIEL